MFGRSCFVFRAGGNTSEMEIRVDEDGSLILFQEHFGGDPGASSFSRFYSLQSFRLSFRIFQSLDWRDSLASIGETQYLNSIWVCLLVTNWGMEDTGFINIFLTYSKTNLFEHKEGEE